VRISPLLKGTPRAVPDIVGVLQQMHHPPTIGEDEQMEIQLDPEEVQDVPGLE
jgi:hypothetical protein